MDLVVHAAGHANPILVDVTVVSAMTQEALRAGAARRDGAAAATAARKKRGKYPGVDVTPFVIEDHGRFGEDALALVRRIAPQEAGERIRALRGLYQTLGSVVQRHSADSLLAATASRSPAPAVIPASSHHAQPQAQAFRDVRLTMASSV
jgi:hypothetical protein